MRTILAILIAYTCLLQSSPARFSFDSQLGLVDANADGKLCLNISNPNLQDGTQVSLVSPFKPQRTVQAIIERKAPSSCSESFDVVAKASFYWVKLGTTKGVFNLWEAQPPAIAVIHSKTSVLVKHGIAIADLDGDGQKEFFRTCTSNEGLHLTVWSGKPLHGKRRWHSYYYLGYDVVPTCKKRDYE